MNRTKWVSAAVVLATVALGVATALPAEAASTKSIAVPDATGGVAVDVSTGRVYVGTTPSYTGPIEQWNSSGGVAMVDVKKKKVVKAVTIFTQLSYAIGSSVADVEVNPNSNDLWVLVGNVTTGQGCSATLYQLDKRSLAVVRHHDLGCSRKIELDPASRAAYLTEAPFYDDRGDDAQPSPPGAVVAVDGATGNVRRATVPSPTTGVFNVTEGYFSTSIAFNSRNRRLYVVGQGTAWAYTTSLDLVHTTALSYPTDAGLDVVADPVENYVYVADRNTLTELSGTTDEVTRTSVQGGGAMVIDPKAGVLYRGTNTVKLSTLRSVGQQARAVAAVDPRHHTRYAVTSGRLYVSR